MSQKAPLPSLTGHRLKTRKRDEKKQYDPIGFRDSILEGLEDSKGDLEAVSKWLDSAGSKLDYRRYGVTLIEILIAGGLLAPGGIIIQDGEVYKTQTSLFGMAHTIEDVRAFEQVFVKLMRRYKYLEKMHEEEMNKILVYLKGFSEDERRCLAQITALWLASGQIPATILPILINEHQVKDGTALEFFLEVLYTLKMEKGGTAIINVIKKSGMESRLIDFFPPSNQQQTEENFAKTFNSRNLPEVVTFRKQQEAQNHRNQVQRMVRNAISEEKPAKEIIVELKEANMKHKIQEQDALVMIWNCVMSAVEWNKKEDLLQEQALRHLKHYIPLFEAFSSNNKSELILLNKIQEYCYDNMNFLKTFNKIVLLLYKTDVLSEDVILKWYRDSHSQRGWSVFMDQMKKFIEWLEHAEEGDKRLSDDSFLVEWHPWLVKSKLKQAFYLSSRVIGDRFEDEEKILSFYIKGYLPLKEYEKVVFERRIEFGVAIWKLIRNGGGDFVITDSNSLIERLVSILPPDILKSEFEEFISTCLTGNVPRGSVLFHCISNYREWFLAFLKHYRDCMIFQQYHPFLTLKLPEILDQIHRASSSPITLYPFELQEFVSLLFMIQQDIEGVIEVVKDRLFTIIDSLESESNFKFLILMFPRAFKTIFHVSAQTRRGIHIRYIPEDFTINQSLP